MEKILLNKKEKTNGLSFLGAAIGNKLLKFHNYLACGFNFYLLFCTAYILFGFHAPIPLYRVESGLYLGCQ